MTAAAAFIACDGPGSVSRLGCAGKVVHEASGSLRQIAAALNGRGIATARGGRWEAQTVANVMRRG